MDTLEASALECAAAAEWAHLTCMYQCAVDPLDQIHCLEAIRRLEKDFPALPRARMASWEEMHSECEDALTI